MTINKNIIDFIARNRGELSFFNREPEFEIKTPEIILKLREHFPDQNFSAAKEDFPKHQKFEYSAKDFYEKNVEKFTVSSTNNQILDNKKQSNYFHDKETIKKSRLEKSPHSKPTHERSLSTIGRNKKIKYFDLKNGDDSSFDEEKNNYTRKKSSFLQNPAFFLEKDEPIIDDLRNTYIYVDPNI